MHMKSMSLRYRATASRGLTSRDEAQQAQTFVFPIHSSLAASKVDHVASANVGYDFRNFPGVP
jgi:hypothetical protein